MLKLKECREAAGISQAELARRVGVSRSRINNYELGVRTADYETLLKIAEALDVSVADLLGVDQEHPELAGLPKDARSLARLSREEILRIIDAWSEKTLRGFMALLESAYCTEALTKYLSGASSVNKTVKTGKSSDTPEED